MKSRKTMATKRVAFLWLSVVVLTCLETHGYSNEGLQICRVNNRECIRVDRRMGAGGQNWALSILQQAGMLSGIVLDADGDPKNDARPQSTASL